jgi:hypothetical protein
MAAIDATDGTLPTQILLMHRRHKVWLLAFCAYWGATWQRTVRVKTRWIAQNSPERGIIQRCKQLRTQTTNPLVKDDAGFLIDNIHA